MEKAFERYRMRVLILAGVLVLVFVFYFCWEVLYQERAIVTLLAFTEMERSKEADRKSFLHEYIIEHGYRKDLAEPGAREASLDLRKLEVAVKDSVKMPSDDARRDTGEGTVADSGPTTGQPLRDMADKVKKGFKVDPIEQMNGLVKAYRLKKLASRQNNTGTNPLNT